MNIEMHGKQRIYLYNNEGFVDLWPIENFGLNLVVHESFVYMAIVKTKDTIEVFFFPDKEWFEEWKNDHYKPEDIKIIYETGRAKA